MTYFTSSEFQGMNVEYIQECFRLAFEEHFAETVSPQGEYIMFLDPLSIHESKNNPNMIKYIHTSQAGIKYNLSDLIISFASPNQSDLIQQRMLVIKTVASMQDILDKFENPATAQEYYVTESTFVNLLVSLIPTTKYSIQDMVGMFENSTYMLTTRKHMKLAKDIAHNNNNDNRTETLKNEIESLANCIETLQVEIRIAAMSLNLVSTRAKNLLTNVTNMLVYTQNTSHTR